MQSAKVRFRNDITLCSGDKNMPSFICQKCEFQQSVSADYVGKKVKCPQCKTVSLVEDELGLEDDLGIFASRGTAFHQRRGARARRWHSNPWSLTGLIVLFTALNIGMTVGGIRLIVNYHLDTINAEMNDFKS